MVDNILNMPQPKRKLQATSPPKRNVKGSKTSEVDCLICEEPILEADEHCAGEDPLFCEGECQGWLHRKCAGVTQPAFQKLGEPENVYLCPCCITNHKWHNFSVYRTEVFV